MSLTLTIALVLSASGEIDESASAQAFESELARYKAERETEESTIAEAVADTFSAHPGASQNMEALVHGALRRLNVQPSAHKLMKDKVLAYVRENADRPAVKDKAGNVLSAAEPARTRLFSISKGVGGGVRRWSDIPVQTESK